MMTLPIYRGEHPADMAEFCVAGSGFVSETFRGRAAAEEFAEQLRRIGAVGDAKVVPAEEGRALKRVMLSRKES